jgi:hypothetical protein
MPGGAPGDPCDRASEIADDVRSRPRDEDGLSPRRQGGRVPPGQLVPDVGERRSVIDTLAADLAAGELVDGLPLRVMMTDNRVRAGRTKPKGREFMGSSAAHSTPTKSDVYPTPAAA